MLQFILGVWTGVIVGFCVCAVCMAGTNARAKASKEKSGDSNDSN